MSKFLVMVNLLFGSGVVSVKVGFSGGFHYLRF